MEIAAGTIRKDAPEKVRGQARYTMDALPPDTVYACIVSSRIARGTIRNVDLTRAQAAPGVLAVFCGKPDTPRGGTLLQDRPILAVDVVRYAGEPLAMVVAQTARQAKAAAQLIQADLIPEKPVLDIDAALAPGAPLLHPEIQTYDLLAQDVYPRPGTNIASSYQIRRGDPDTALARCAYVIEKRYNLPPTDHCAMEPRSVLAQLRADGTLWIKSATQAPFSVRQLVALAMHLDEGKVEVEVPYVGGGYGGKTAVQLEYLAAMAAMALPGKPVCLTHDRGQDMTVSPIRLGMKAWIKLGADASGTLRAAKMDVKIDCGAYSDIGPYMAKAAAVDCTGPYSIDALSCDVSCVYTNHTYCTAFRGFVHESQTFCMERTIDELARRMGMDPLQMREKSVLHPGQQTPTQVEVTPSNLGNPQECIRRLRRQMDWDAGSRVMLGNGIIRAKGISCLWKTPNPSSDAGAGAVVTFNDDGSANLQVAVVEMGNGGLTRLCQILAQQLRMPYDRIHVCPTVNTRAQPKYWKTAASLSNYLAGRAVMAAACDAIEQLKQNAAFVLRVATDDLEIGEERVYVRHQPKYAIGFQDIVMGVSQKDGSSVGAPVIGRGSFIMPHIGPLAKDTGKGKTGHSWTVGAQGVEIELDTKDATYRLLRAVTVMDVGTVIDRGETCAMLRGGMSMGLSLAREEALVWDDAGIPQTTSLRTYKPMHIGEEPRYVVELLCTPQLDAPLGARSFSEHGIIGMPAALANALSNAAGVSLDALPLTPESIYRSLLEQSRQKEATP